MPNDVDLFLTWAAEEFVAAGRAEQAERRRLHRRKAEFYADIMLELRRDAGVAQPGRPQPAEVGRLLAHAFTGSESASGR